MLKEETEYKPVRNPLKNNARLLRESGESVHGTVGVHIAGDCINRASGTLSQAEREARTR